MNNKNETNDKKCFDTIDGAALMSTPLQPLRFVADSLISQGLHVLAGSPKVGKFTGILDNRTYLGHMAGLRSTTLSYKNKKLIRHPESEQILVKNTHELLISHELWDIVQEVRQHKKRTPKQMDEPNMFLDWCTAPTVERRLCSIGRTR
jgi:hypothetical protein